MAPPYTDLFADYSVKFKQANVKKIAPHEGDREDGAGGVVAFEDGSEQSFDWLVVSLGGVINLGAHAWTLVAAHFWWLQELAWPTVCLAPGRAQLNWSQCRTCLKTAKPLWSVSPACCSST